jgi:hypothetical protein
MAERRRDSCVAWEIVLALPTDRELDQADRIALVREFAIEHFVRKGVAVQIDLHVPDHSAVEGGERNYHAHLLIVTRRVEGESLSSHKAIDIEPQRRSIGGRRIIVEAEQWGEVWARHQDSYFGGHDKGITVDPVAPVPQEHIGPIRFRAPSDQRIAANEQVKKLNTKIARDPAAVAEHLGQRPFDGRALDRFLTKHLPPEEREAIALDVRTRLHNLQREALNKAAWADKVASGLRPLSVEDIARELSPDYAAAIKQAAVLREDARKADWIRNRQTADKEAGEYRVNERWSEMGIARRALHLVGAAFPSVSVLRDIELDRWTSLNKQGARAEERWAIRGAAISGGEHGSPSGDLHVVARLAEVELEKIRPQAERVLDQRRRIAQNARAQLEAMNKATLTLDTTQRRDKLTARRRRSYSRGPSP